MIQEVRIAYDVTLLVKDLAHVQRHGHELGRNPLPVFGGVDARTLFTLTSVIVVPAEKGRCRARPRRPSRASTYQFENVVSVSRRFVVTPEQSTSTSLRGGSLRALSQSFPMGITRRVNALRIVDTTVARARLLQSFIARLVTIAIR